MPNTACQRPQALPVQVEYIPAVLKVRPQWIGWHYAWRAGKRTIIPTDPGTGRKARSNDPTTWGGFLEVLECCQRCRLDGIGFVFAADDPYCGVDLDECHDPATGQIEPWADTIIREVDSYTEVSPVAPVSRSSHARRFPLGATGKAKSRCTTTAAISP
jgi:putative DNA primase/helicase